MSLQEEISFLLSKGKTRQVENFEIIEIELPIENYEEIKEELFDRGFDVTEQEWKDGRKFLEIIKEIDNYVVVSFV